MRRGRRQSRLVCIQTTSPHGPCQHLPLWRRFLKLMGRSARGMDSQPLPPRGEGHSGVEPPTNLDGKGHLKLLQPNSPTVSRDICNRAHCSEPQGPTRVPLPSLKHLDTKHSSLSCSSTLLSPFITRRDRKNDLRLLTCAR